MSNICTKIRSFLSPAYGDLLDETQSLLRENSDLQERNALLEQENRVLRQQLDEATYE